MIKDDIRQRAAELGFDDCRFTTAAPPTTAAALRSWLASGYHGEMAWLARNVEKRVDPRRVLPEVKSIVLVAASYGNPQPPAAEDPPGMADGSQSQATSLQSGISTPKAGIVARYARFADYHDVVGAQLRALSNFVDQVGGPGTRSLWYVDTGPVLEREYAERAGIGFVGKHTNVISRRFGNWILLGEILTPLELEPDMPEKNRCGTCTRCLDACPTRAITAPFQLDARLCISYLTIESRGPISVELRPAVGHRIFGCDDCLAACPWNRFAREGRLMRTGARPELAALDLLESLAIDDEEFKRRFAETPLMRVRRRGLRRNACIALGNVGDARCLPALEAASADPDTLVAEHARWAIGQIVARSRT